MKEGGGREGRGIPGCAKTAGIPLSRFQVLQRVEKDIRLRPGESLTLDMPMDNNAQFVAVAALLIDPDLPKNTWRRVLTLDDFDPDKPRIIEASHNTLTLAPLKDE